MTAVVEVQENGLLPLPAEMQAIFKPHSRVRLETRGDEVIVTSAGPGTESMAEKSRRIWDSRTPAERVSALNDWIAGLPPRTGPALPDEALGRNSIYD